MAAAVLMVVRIKLDPAKRVGALGAHSLLELRIIIRKN